MYIGKKLQARVAACLFQILALFQQLIQIKVLNTGSLKIKEVGLC